MKKLILLCSFGLLGSFAFAGNEVENRLFDLKNLTLENASILEGQGDYICTSYEASCGVIGIICWRGTLTQGMLDNFDKALCPLAPQ